MTTPKLLSDGEHIEVSIELLEQASNMQVAGMEAMDGKLMVYGSNLPVPRGIYVPEQFLLYDAVPHGTEGRHVVVMRLAGGGTRL